jgi:hypothetical protein
VTIQKRGYTLLDLPRLYMAAQGTILPDEPTLIKDNAKALIDEIFLEASDAAIEAAANALTSWYQQATSTPIGQCYEELAAHLFYKREEIRLTHQQAA